MTQVQAYAMMTLDCNSISKGFVDWRCITSGASNRTRVLTIRALITQGYLIRENEFYGDLSKVGLTDKGHNWLSGNPKPDSDFKVSR